MCVNPRNCNAQYEVFFLAQPPVQDCSPGGHFVEARSPIFPR